MLNKEECENALINICSSNSKVKDRKTFKQLIHEHFDNPPLKFEELKPDMWVWDNDRKEYSKIVDVIGWDEDEDEPAFLIVFEPNEYDCWVENRFYKKEVEDDES